MRASNSISSILLFVLLLSPTYSVDPKWKTPVTNKRNITSRSQRTETDPQSSYYSRLEDFKLPDYRSRAGANNQVIPSNNLPRHHVAPMVPPEFLGRPGFNRIPHSSKPPGGFVHSSVTPNVPSSGIVFYPTNGIPPFMYNPANNTFIAVPGVAWTPWNGQLIPYLAGASSIPPQGQYGPTEPSPLTSENIPTDAYTDGAGYSPSATPEGFDNEGLSTYSSSHSVITSSNPTSPDGSSLTTAAAVSKSALQETNSYYSPSATTSGHFEVEPATKNYESPDEFYSKTTYGGNSELTSSEGYPTLVHTSSSHADITPSGYTESHVSSNPTGNRPTDHPVYPGEHDQFEIPDLNEDYSPHTNETPRNGEEKTTSSLPHSSETRPFEEPTKTTISHQGEQLSKETETLVPVTAQTYQPPSTEKAEDILTNLDVKLVRPTCVGGSCGEKISVYTPPKGPKLLISSAAKSEIPAGVSSRRPSSNFHPTKLPMPTVMERKFLPFVPADEQLQFGVNTRGPHVFMQPHEFPEPTNTMRETSFQPTTAPYNPTYKPVPNSYKTTESPLEEENTTPDTFDSTEYEDEYTEDSKESTPSYLEGSSKFTTNAPISNNQYETTDGYSPTYKPLYPENVATTTVSVSEYTAPTQEHVSTSTDKPTFGAPGRTPFEPNEVYENPNRHTTVPRTHISSTPRTGIPNEPRQEVSDIYPERPSSHIPGIPPTGQELENPQKPEAEFPEKVTERPNAERTPMNHVPEINAPGQSPFKPNNTPNHPDLGQTPSAPNPNNANKPNTNIPDRNPFGPGSGTPNRPSQEIPGTYPERPNSNIPERPPFGPASQSPNKPSNTPGSNNQEIPNEENPSKTPFNPDSERSNTPGINSPARPPLPTESEHPNQPEEDRTPFGPSSNNHNRPNTNKPDRNPSGPGSGAPNRPSEIPGTYPERPNSNVPGRSPFIPGSENPIVPDQGRNPFGPISNNPNRPNTNKPDRNPFSPGSGTPNRPSQEIPGTYPERPNSNVPGRPPFGPASQSPNKPSTIPGSNNQEIPNEENPSKTPFNPDSERSNTPDINSPARPPFPTESEHPNQPEEDRTPFGPSSNNPNRPNTNKPDRNPFGPGSGTPNRPSQEIPGTYPERPNSNIPERPPFGPASQSPNKPSNIPGSNNQNIPNEENRGRTPFSPDSERTNTPDTPGRPLTPDSENPSQPEQSRNPFGPNSHNPNRPNGNIPDRNPFGPGSETPRRPSQELPGINAPGRPPFTPDSENPIVPERGRTPFSPGSNNPNRPNSNIPERSPFVPGSGTPNRPLQEIPGTYPERPNSNIPERPPFGPASESPGNPNEPSFGRTPISPNSEEPKSEKPEKPGEGSESPPRVPGKTTFNPNDGHPNEPEQTPPGNVPTDKYPEAPNEPTRIPNIGIGNVPTTTPSGVLGILPPGRFSTVTPSTPGTDVLVSTTLLPPRNSTNYYSEQEATVPLSYQRVTGPPPIVANRVRGKTRIICKENGLEFGASTIFPFSGVIFAKDRKRIAACTKNYTNEENPTIFLPFLECGVRNAGEQSQRTQYHMQVVVVVEQTDGTSSIQSYMAQCVHQKVNKNKQALPKRIDEALEELRLVPIKLEQQAIVPSVDMQIMVDQGHDGLGPEVAEVDIGMPLVIRWKLTPASHSYGFQVKNCFVEDSISGTQMMLIDEVGCSSDATILSHPHYDIGHDTATSKMWAFKVPDHMKLKLHCDIVICSEIVVPGNYSSCARIPTPPFCPDVITSPPNSILYDAEGGFRKRRRDTLELSETQTVRAALCLGENCEVPREEMFVCFNLHILIASTALSFSLFVTSVILHLAMRKRRQSKV